MENKNIYKIIYKTLISLFVFVVLLWGAFGFGTVRAGERGVKTRFGKVVGINDTGLYIKIPFIEKVNKIDVKTRTVNYDKGGDTGEEKPTLDNLFGASKDLQDVAIGVVVNYHINPIKVELIYTQYKSVLNYEQNVIEPMIREIVKSTASQYTAEELVTKRSEFSEKVNFILNERFFAKDAILERFSITNFEFSDEFTKSIELKVTAVQNAEASKNKLEQVKFEAQQTIETAKAQAESIRIQAQAIMSQGGADYVKLQAINRWSGNLPQYMIPGAVLPFLGDSMISK